MLVPPAGHIQERLKNVSLYNLNEHKQKESKGFWMTTHMECPYHLLSHI